LSNQELRAISESNIVRCPDETILIKWFHLLNLLKVMEIL
jgi:hypothetical protein